MKVTTSSLLLLLCGVFTSCNNAGKSTQNAEKAPVVSNVRTVVKKEAIASYEEKVPDKLNDWYFGAKLFETEKTFRFRIEMRYKEITPQSIITFPDLGVTPRPAIRKGKDKLTCIIGFLDENDNFKEYQILKVDDRGLSLYPLKQYRRSKVE